MMITNRLLKIVLLTVDVLMNRTKLEFVALSTWLLFLCVLEHKSVCWQLEISGGRRVQSWPRLSVTEISHDSKDAKEISCDLKHI